jgi:hypothetical protein
MHHRIGAFRPNLDRPSKKDISVLPTRRVLCTILLAFVALAALGPHAQAQGKLEAHYTASLAGIPIGKGNWTIDIGEGHYTAAASGMTIGLIKVFTGGRGTGLAQGTLAGGRSVASNYSATIKTSHHTDEVRMTLAGGAVKDFKLDPPQDPDPRRIPVTETQRQGVVDPMTASLVFMPGTGEMRGPQACERSLSIFDGKLRYDLRLAYKRMESVKAEKGYAGPVVVCAVSFAPVAGYIPTRTAIKYLAEKGDIEVWLAPIAGTRVLVPFRAQVGTPFGLGMLEATQFVSVAGKGVKTQ